jgi:hypothetical protein
MLVNMKWTPVAEGKPRPGVNCLVTVRIDPHLALQCNVDLPRYIPLPNVKWTGEDWDLSDVADDEEAQAFFSDIVAWIENNEIPVYNPDHAAEADEAQSN